MKRFIKTISIVLLAVMATASFGGCGEETIDNGDATVITIWTSSSHSKSVYDEIINEWNETEGKKKGIFIDYVLQAGDSSATNVELALQTGDAPDMFSSGSIQKMSELGYIAAIDDLPGGPEFIEEHKEYLRNEKNVWNGKTYTVPVYATTRALIYNVQMFKDAGLVDENGEPTPPKTFDELREYAKILTDDANDQYGIILPLKWSSFFNGDITSMLQSSVGHSGFNPATGEYELDGYIPILQTYVDMKNDGSIYPGADSIDNDMARAYFAEGNIGMKLAYSFDVGVLTNQFPAKIEWGVAELPVIDENNRYKQLMTQASSQYINSEVLEDPDKAEKIMEVLKFFTSDEFIGKVYQAGVSLPVDKEVVANTKLENPPAGWKEFADMVQISEIARTAPTISSSGYLSLKDRFMNDVWSGKMSPEQMIKEYKSDFERAVAEELKDDPDIINRYVIPDYDVSR